ncbi:MAG: hypothetical protein EHM18_16905, partial [Acidobacteria bacterium]
MIGRRIGWALFLCLSVSLALGQEFRGSLVGRVTDQTKGILPGATVTVMNQETNASANTVTNDQGNYRLPFLLPGTYKVSVEMTGFRRTETTIRMSVGTDVTLDLTLQVGEIDQTVTVTDSTPLISSSNADLGQVISNDYAQNAPVLLARNIMNRVTLTPGVTQNLGEDAYSSNAQTEFSISGGGSKRGGNEIVVDGIPNTVANAGGIALFTPSLDLVQEMKVHTTLFDASFGRSNGGAINITTRGGTNEYHGSVYDYKRWKALNANTWENNRLNLPKPGINYNQYGGVFGGPIWIPGLYNGKNRTFFLVSYEADADKRNIQFRGRVPTELERKGDFSQTLNLKGAGMVQIYDPWTTTGSGSNAKRTPFPDSKIPAERLSPIGLAVAHMYPLPTTPGTPRIAQFNSNATGP